MSKEPEEFLRKEKKKSIREILLKGAEISAMITFSGALAIIAAWGIVSELVGMIEKLIVYATIVLFIFFGVKKTMSLYREAKRFV